MDNFLMTVLGGFGFFFFLDKMENHCSNVPELLSSSEDAHKAITMLFFIFLVHLSQKQFHKTLSQCHAGILAHFFLFPCPLLKTYVVGFTFFPFLGILVLARSES